MENDVSYLMLQQQPVGLTKQYKLKLYTGESRIHDAAVRRILDGEIQIP